MGNLSAIRKLFGARDMTIGKPWKSILLFTVPMLVGNVLQQLYSTVDAIVVGRYIGDDALAAIGATTSLFFLLLVLFIGIGSGAGIMVSQYFGAKMKEELSHTIGTAIMTTTLVAVIMSIFMPLGTRQFLVLLRTPENIIEQSTIYLNVLLWGAVALGLYNILTGILRGLGDSFSPLLYLGIASVLNIALDILFIAGFGWGIWSPALATVISQGVASVLTLRKLMKMHDVFHFGLKYLLPESKYVKEVVRLGLPTGISQAVFSVAMVLVQPLMNGFGSVFIAVNTIVMRIDGFIVMPIFSFGAAAMTFTGQNAGAGNFDRVRQGTRQNVLLSVGTIVVLVAAVLLFGRDLAHMFTSTQQIIDATAQMLRILAFGYVGFAIANVFWSVLRGAGDTVTPMWASIFVVVAVRVPLAYILVHYMQRPEALFFSMLITWSFNGILGFLAYRFTKWHTRALTARNSG